MELVRQPRGRWPWCRMGRGRSGESAFVGLGCLRTSPSDDAELQSRNAAFVQGVQKLDWEVGRDVQIDCRWTLGSAERMRDYAAELVALAPDVLLAVGAEVVETLQRATRAVPIVFVLRACSGRNRGR